MDIPVVQLPEPSVSSANAANKSFARTGTMRRRKSVILRHEDRPNLHSIMKKASESTLQLNELGEQEVLAVQAQVSEIKRQVEEQVTKLQELLREADDNDIQITMLRTQIAAAQSSRERDLKDCAETTFRLEREYAKLLSCQKHLDATIGGEERRYAACKQAVAQQSVQLAFNFQPRSQNVAEAAELELSVLFSANALAHNVSKQSEEVLAWWTERRGAEEREAQSKAALESQEWYKAEMHEKMEKELRAKEEAVRSGKIIVEFLLPSNHSQEGTALTPQKPFRQPQSRHRFARAAERAVGEVALRKLQPRSYPNP